MRFRVLLKGGISTYFRRKSTSLQPFARAAEKEAAGETLTILRELSSGPYSSARLRQMGHPYRIGGTPPMDPAIINAQTGKFRAAWRVDPPRKRADGLSTRIVNTQPYAVYLLSGTGKMIARPILGRMREKLRPIRQRIWRQHLAKWLGSG
jgi:hypothetical protein